MGGQVSLKKTAQWCWVLAAPRALWVRPAPVPPCQALEHAFSPGLAMSGAGLTSCRRDTRRRNSLPPPLASLACTWKPSCLCSGALIFPQLVEIHFQKDPPFEGLLPVPAPRIATWLLALSCQEAVLPELAVSSQLPKSSGNILSLAP